MLAKRPIVYSDFQSSVVVVVVVITQIIISIHSFPLLEMRPFICFKEEFKSLVNIIPIK